MKDKSQQLDELKVGGGATGVSDSGPGPAGGTATLPASKKQGDGMEKIQDPNNPGQEDTSTENNTKATGDMSAKNRASVAMKPSAASSSMKEEVKAAFEGTEISEDIVGAVAALLEKAVDARVQAIAEDLETQYNTALDQNYEAALGEIAEAVDAYMDMVAEKFVTENALAIESGIRAELVESFLGGLKGLFEEHYVDVPADKVDVAEELTQRVAELEEQLNKTMNENADLRKKEEAVVRESVVKAVAEGLTVTQQEKFLTLAEGVEFGGDAEDFRARLTGVKDQFFAAEKKPAATSLTEGAETPIEQPAVKVNPSVARYVDALSRKR